MVYRHLMADKIKCCNLMKGMPYGRGPQFRALDKYIHKTVRMHRYRQSAL